MKMPVAAGAKTAAVLVAAAGGLAGCGGAGEVSLANAQESEVALAAAVSAALETSDRGALQGLLVTRDEYEHVLWPEMPDGEYTPFDFVWGLNEINSGKGLRDLLYDFGGQSLEIVSVTLPDETESYETFTLHKGVEVVVRRTDTGEEGILSSFDVFVEHESGWKLLNYDEL